ncbi:MAG: hypothetical protein AB1330_01670 [Bacillota bacterium]
MKILIDRCHNPLRGYAACSGCGCPIVHIEGDWHEPLAREVARAFGVEWKIEHLWKTPSEWYPAMSEKAARLLCRRVQHYLFCPYCGRAVTQPFISDVSGAKVLPLMFYGEHFEAAGRWAAALGLSQLPVDDYDKWNKMAYAQRESGKPIIEFYN